ncbi:MAG: dual specificity protein phosphatase family protein [Armatimonadetes bacterium]|nr:dual specificity protein phosphatase family protein [Armatimonadota bacterium]
MPRPHSGDRLGQDLQYWRLEGLETIVCLLAHDEVKDLGLKSEGRLWAEMGGDFIHFPITDRGVPTSVKETIALVQEITAQLRAGTSVGVHCRAGIGRASLIAACTLHQLGISHRDIYPAISRARGIQVPDTSQQIDWLDQFVKL